MTEGAEFIPWKDPIYEVVNAILDCCITEGMPDFIRCFYIPDSMQNKSPYAVGVCRGKYIFIKKAYYQEHGIDEDVINTVFHEMIHFRCGWTREKIKDTDGDYHLPAYKETCEKYGGMCFYTNEKNGYNNAQLTPESMEKVREIIERRRKRA